MFGIVVTERISTADIRAWQSLEEIVDSLTGRGLQITRESPEGVDLSFQTGESMHLFVVEKGSSQASNLTIADLTEEFDLVFTVQSNFEEFDLYARPSAGSGLGQPTIAHFGFSIADLNSDNKSQSRVDERLNEIDGYDGSSFMSLFTEEPLIEEFTTRYEELVMEVAAAVESSSQTARGVRERYSQQLINRVLYLFLLEDTDILPNHYLSEHHARFEFSQENLWDVFYEPVFRGDPPGEVSDESEPFWEGVVRESLLTDEAAEVRPPRDPNKAHDLFSSILEFLSRWDWEIGGEHDFRHATRVTARTVGHSLERFINKQNTSAYHTPEQLRYTFVRDAIDQALVRKIQSKTDIQIESLDQLFDSALDMRARRDDEDPIIVLYREILPEFRVVDPAVGSGAFLQEAQTFLTEIYTECFNYLTGSGIGVELDLPTFESEKEQVQFYRVRAMRQNLFGVDLNPDAIHLTRFRLQLSALDASATVYDSNQHEIEYRTQRNLFTGNSLIGVVERPSWQPDSDQLDLYEFVDTVSNYRSMIRQYRTGESGSSELLSQINPESARLTRQYNTEVFDRLQEFSDVEVSNTSAVVDGISPFHWWAEFPNIMVAGGFDVVISNPPWNDIGKSAKARPNRLNDATGSENDVGSECAIDTVALQQAYFEEQYEVAAGKLTGYSSLFIERATRIGAPDAVVSMLVSGDVFDTRSAEPVRRLLFDNTTLRQIVGFENHDIFTDIERRYEFGLVRFNNSGETRSVHAKFGITSLEWLGDSDQGFVTLPRALIEAYSPSVLALPAVNSEQDLHILERLLKHSELAAGDGWNIALHRGIHQTRHADALSEKSDDYPIYRGRNIFQYVSTGEYHDVSSPSYWGVDPGREKPSAKTIVRDQELRALTRNVDITREGDELIFGSGELVPVDEVPMPYEEYRIAYRDIARASDERVVIAAVLPPGVLTVNTLHTVHPLAWKGRDNESLSPEVAFENRYSLHELFSLLGVLNSSAFDYLMRIKVDSHLSDYLVEEASAPYLSPDSELGNFVSTRAAQLSCYDERLDEIASEMGVQPVVGEQERCEIQAEIDAAVFHAYGFDDTAHVQSVLDEPPRVRSARILDEGYISTVVESFADLGGGLDD